MEQELIVEEKVEPAEETPKRRARWWLNPRPKKKKVRKYKRKVGRPKKKGRKPKPNPVGRPPKRTPPGPVPVKKRKARKKKPGRKKSQNPRKVTSCNGTVYWRAKKKRGRSKTPGRPKKRGPKTNHQRNYWRRNRVRINRENRLLWKKMHPAKIGRKPKDWIPFPDAREIIRKEQIHSQKAWARWWNLNQPPRIPKYPNRTYKDFVSWNDWLGNNNTFNGNSPQKRWRSYQEATVFARSIKVYSQQEWLQWIADNENSFPTDIPRRPETHYKDWISWFHFLGKHPSERLKDLQEEQDPTIFYVYHEDADAPNVFRVGIDPKGPGGILDKWKIEPTFRVIRMFRYHKRHGTDITETLKRYSTPQWGEENVRIVPNLPELLWALSSIMEIVTPPK